MRERWFGSTGRRVAEVTVEGELDVAGALVVNDVHDDKELRAAFQSGTPVVVRASSPEAIKAALRRPEVSSVLVPPERRDLLELDLTELTYG